jgi:hypothetical protein
VLDQKQVIEHLANSTSSTPAVATAMIDRLIHHADKGDSYRPKNHNLSIPLAIQAAD